MIDLGSFKKLEITQHGTENCHRGECHIDKKTNTLHIPKAVVEKLGWINRERVDIYSMGHTFALKPSKVGCLRARPYGKAMCITSLSMRLTIASIAHDATEFETWVEEDVLFIRAKED